MWGPGRKMAFGAAPGSEEQGLVHARRRRPQRGLLSHLSIASRFMSCASSPRRAARPPVDDAADGQHSHQLVRPRRPRLYRRQHPPRVPADQRILLRPRGERDAHRGDIHPRAARRAPVHAGLRALAARQRGQLRPGPRHAPARAAHAPAGRLDLHRRPLQPRHDRLLPGAPTCRSICTTRTDTSRTSYDRAGPGNVAVGAEIGIRAGSFQLAIGFAHTRADAEEVARNVLQKGAAQRARRLSSAHGAPCPICRRPSSKVSGDEGMLARASLSVLRCLEDKSHAGAFVASPCIAVGREQPQRQPRLSPRLAARPVPHRHRAARLRRQAPQRCARSATCRRGSALMAVGFRTGSSMERRTGRRPSSTRSRCRSFLRGVWASASCLDHDPYPAMVRPAAQFLIREGPLTQLDRWEDLGGLSPSTLAACVAALIVAAEFAHEAGEHVAAQPSFEPSPTTGTIASKRGAQRRRANS